ncbi:MAG: hypothetical protein EBR94_01040 [Bacteroidetes bacterium]|nr:hypothetical protein [Bacteroidota bacterium]
MTLLLNILTALTTFLALISARVIVSWQKSYSDYKTQSNPANQFFATHFRQSPLLPHENAALVAINYMGQQNQMMLSAFLSTYQKMINDILSDLNEKKDEKSDNYEILCKDEFIEDVKRLMDSSSEKVVKEMAMWATENVEKFNLSLGQVSIETESSADSNHATDVLVVFHVKGAGENALRFQSEASRFLREIVSRSDHPSLQFLRADVRWQ